MPQGATDGEDGCCRLKSFINFKVLTDSEYTDTIHFRVYRLYYANVTGNTEPGSGKYVVITQRN